MGSENLNSKLKRPVRFRLCKVSSHTTELLEIVSDDPALHVLFIPGNPGVVWFYKDFLESLFELLGGSASVTAIGHISFTKKNWEHGKLFSLQQQIDHKVDFIRQELQNTKVPIVLVGHSVGAYISIETLRRYPQKVIHFTGLYPFLMFDPLSKKQPAYKEVSESPIHCALLSLCIGFLGLLPNCAKRLIVSASIGKSWSPTAVDAACSHLLQYHTFRNMLFLAMTEFRKDELLHPCNLEVIGSSCKNSLSVKAELSEVPDWEFMREIESKITFLFGVDDHWGPLEMYEEISKQVPGIALSIEREGLAHNFCCTEASSVWVAQHVASLIKNKISSSSQRG